VTVEISDDQNEATVTPAQAVRLRFVQAEIGTAACPRCYGWSPGKCMRFPCYPKVRKDGKRGYFVEVPDEHE